MYCGRQSIRLLVASRSPFLFQAISFQKMITKLGQHLTKLSKNPGRVVAIYGTSHWSLADRLGCAIQAGSAPRHHSLSPHRAHASEYTTNARGVLVWLPGFLVYHNHTKQAAKVSLVFGTLEYDNWYTKGLMCPTKAIARLPKLSAAIPKQRAGYQNTIAALPKST